MEIVIVLVPIILFMVFIVIQLYFIHKDLFSIRTHLESIHALIDFHKIPRDKSNELTGSGTEDSYDPKKVVDDLMKDFGVGPDAVN